MCFRVGVDGVVNFALQEHPSSLCLKRTPRLQSVCRLSCCFVIIVPYCYKLGFSINSCAVVLFIEKDNTPLSSNSGANIPSSEIEGLNRHPIRIRTSRDPRGWCPWGLLPFSSLHRSSLLNHPPRRFNTTSRLDRPNNIPVLRSVWLSVNVIGSTGIHNVNTALHELTSLISLYIPPPNQLGRIFYQLPTSRHLIVIYA